MYISLTGISEPLGRSQVLEYLTTLSRENRIHIISFERIQDLECIDEVKCITERNNIEWKYFFYSNKYGIFSSIKQIFLAIIAGSKLIRKYNIELVHARSMIPAVMGLVLKKVHNIKLLFDIRGFAVDEKLDSGLLKQSDFLYKILKKIDNYLYHSSDHIVTLTYKAKKILVDKKINFERVTVIPTCANGSVFKVIEKVEKDKFKRSLGYSYKDKVIIHTGTVSGWYDFASEVRLIREIMTLNNSIHFLVVNKSEHLLINDVIEKYKLDKNRVKIISASFDEMYKYLGIADCSLFFIKPSYSKLASMPTKFAENIACHLPSVTNYGVGDMEFYMKNYDVGYLVDLKKLDSNLSNVSNEVIKMIQSDAIDTSEYNNLFHKHLDKDIAVSDYQLIYDSMCISVQESVSDS